MSKKEFEFTGERLVPENKNCAKDTTIYAEHIARYEFTKKFIGENDCVLDIACGVGYGSAYLSNNTKAKYVLGIDNDYQTIEYANISYKNDNCTFKQMDVSKLEIVDSSFDFIISFETIEHVQNYKKMISEIHRVLKNSATFVISTPNKEVSDGSNEFHLQEFTITELLQELNPYFSNFVIFAQRKWEVFGKMSTLLHLRYFVKMFRGKKYHDVVDVKEINPLNIQNFIVMCKKK